MFFLPTCRTPSRHSRRVSMALGTTSKVSCKYICICVYIYTHTNIYMYVYIYIYTGHLLCILGACLCHWRLLARCPVYIYIYTYIHALYIYIYIHIHTHTEYIYICIHIYSYTGHLVGILGAYLWHWGLLAPLLMPAPLLTCFETTVPFTIFRHPAWQRVNRYVGVGEGVGEGVG